MASLDYRTLNINAGNLKVVKDAALEIAESKLSSARGDFLESFENHEVTKEIEAGELASNSSGTLGGYGNLFSFIGFDGSDKPTEIVKNLIRKIRLINKSYKKAVANGVMISFSVNVPSISSFENSTPIPWASGRSWLLGIERGISGLGYFVSKLGLGRSGGGVQSDSKIRTASYSSTSYFSRMYNDFIKKIKNTR
jgi:hypothetical protein